MRARRQRPLRRWVFRLAPALAALLAAELAVRAFRLDDKAAVFQVSADENVGLIQPDEHLFWTMKPNVEVDWLVPIKTNAAGLRGEGIGEKAPDEVRLLVVGESSAFGYGVRYEETFGQELERRLNGRRTGKTFNVINAGHCAYSTFQGVEFLKRKGLALKPDAVLFYFEENDAFPGSFRFTGINLIGYSRSDKQLYEFLHGAVTGPFYRRSALFRWCAQGVELAKVRLRTSTWEARQISQFGPTREGASRRVYPEERRALLNELFAVCREAGVKLLLIHPGYARSQQHECELTEEARRGGVPVFDAIRRIDESGVPRKDFFIDGMHPDAAGHRLLGRWLAEALAALNWA